jgi:dipeptidyl aminopeptidase/acylaminoacyl peptidase
MKSCFAAMLSTLSLASSVYAARPIQVEDMQKLARIGDAHVSPDGTTVAFTVTHSDVARNKSFTNVWVVSATGGDARQMTFGDTGSNTDVSWSPDSKLLYFVSTRAGNKRQIFSLRIGGGEAKPITNVPTGVDSYVLSHDGKTIAMVATVFPSCTDIACNEKKAREFDERTVKARIITDVPFRRWDTWVDGKRNHIFVVSAEGGGPVRDLTPGDADSPVWTEDGGGQVAFSPDDQEIAFPRYTANEALTGNADLFTVAVSGGPARAITHGKSYEGGPRYSPDGRYIAYGGTVRPGAESDPTRLFLYDRRTGEARNLFERLDRSLDSYEWAPDSRSLYITYEDRGEEPVVRIDVATARTTTLVAKGMSSDVSVPHDGKFLVFSNTDFAHPKELFRLEVTASGGSAPKALTSLNPAALRDFDLGESTSFTYPGWHDEMVQAWQVKPPSFDPAKKYPLLLLMHGGPHSSWANQFHYRWNAQLFAAAGYVVILPNFHGSDGFGLTFYDSIKGQWGGAPYEDQMKAVDVALTWPYVDQTRLAAAGASYGGYMANWLEGHTTRFRTIVNHDGLYDLVGMMYSTDIVGWSWSEQKGRVWDNQQALIDQAPSTYAKNFVTPMLIVHGERDYRVDLSQGIATFQALQEKGVPSKLLLFQEENHWVLKPADSILWYHTVLEWLDEWVKPDRAQYDARMRRGTAAPH